MVPGAVVHKAAAAGDYGTVIRLCRRERGLTLHELGEACGYSHSALSRLERRGRWGAYDIATLRRIAQVLDIGPDLLGLGGHLTPPHGSTRRAPPGRVVFPAGRVFSPDLPVARQEGTGRRSDDRVVLDPSGTGDLASTRGVLLAEVDDGLVAVDARWARRRLARAASNAPLIVPSAYVLDDLTIGVAWAVANLDESLLGDDARLQRAQRRLVEQAPSRPAAVVDNTQDLHPVSKMWLGSSFCARHILDNMHQLAAPPAFWTQERSGEEASGWLLFAHKLDYLRSTATRFKGADMGRAFCIPGHAVATASGPERVLMLLAAALIESFGIRVTVSAEPGYTTIEGCVLDSDRQAIVASWVGVEALWHVGITRDRPAVGDFSDAINYAATHSVIAARKPSDRLHALADYLDLDWTWLVRRCLELSQHGTAGLAEPCSRLLSVAGIDRACEFLGRMRPAAHP